MKYCVLAVILCLVVAPALAADKPNVLFIVVDDLNDWVGALGGHPQAETPNIDRLAERGILFTNCHAPAPTCNPSRAAVMTGVRPSTSGVYFNSNPWRTAMPNAVTIPQHFMAEGYESLGSGKVYHNRFPDPPSWHRYFPSKEVQKPPDPLPSRRPLNGIPDDPSFDWGPLVGAASSMGDVQVVDWIAIQLGLQYDRPFFMACGIFRPHLPWYVPATYFKPFALEAIRLPLTVKNDLDDVPQPGIRMARPDREHAKVLKYDQWHQAVRGYLSSVAFADAQVGRVLDALDRSPHARDTIIVLWSDHGMHLGEKQHWRKNTLWEESTRIPMVIVAPRVATPGSRCDKPVNLIDIFPTLIELCGLPARNGLDGVSLTPLLANPNAKWERPSLTTRGHNNHALRSDRYRYIRYADGREELYDHEVDPNEWTNVAAEPEYSDVKKRLAAWFPKTNAPEVVSPKREGQ